MLYWNSNTFIVFKTQISPLWVNQISKIQFLNKQTLCKIVKHYFYIGFWLNHLNNFECSDYTTIKVTFYLCYVIF